MTDIIISILFVIISIGLNLPFMFWPMDDHFSFYAIWALHRTQGDRLPQYLVLANQGGFSRVFLYYVSLTGLWFVRKEQLLYFVRGVQLSVNILTAIILFYGGRKILGADLVPATLTGLIFLYVSSRPQFELLKTNPEPYYGLFSTASILLILVIIRYEPGNPWLFSLPVFLLVFAGLNAKILFCLDALLVSIGLILTTGMSLELLGAILVGGVTALCLFALFIGGIRAENIKTLFRYTNYFKNNSRLDNLKWNYQAFYYRSPLLAYFIIFLGTLLFLPWEKFSLILILSCVSSIIIVIKQDRFCTYFFQLFFPLTALAMLSGMDQAWKLNGLFLILFVVTFIYLARVSFFDFFTYYKKCGGIAQHKQAFGDFYTLSSYDFRLDSVLSHIKTTTGPFIAWGTARQLHVLANRKPLFMGETTLPHGNAMYPERQKMFLDAARKDTPEWLYDFAGIREGHHRFLSPVFYLATGIAYKPVKRVENVLYYELLRKDDGLYSNDLNFFLENSFIFDLLKNQVKLLDQEIGISLEWNNTLTDLIGGLLLKKKYKNPLFVEGRKMQAPDSPNLISFYQSIHNASLEKNDKARDQFANWQANGDLFIQMHPPLKIYSEVLKKILYPSTEINFLEFTDIWDLSAEPDISLLIKLCDLLSEYEALNALERRTLTALVKNLALDDTDYQSFERNNITCVRQKLLDIYDSSDTIEAYSYENNQN